MSLFFRGGFRLSAVVLFSGILGLVIFSQHRPCDPTYFNCDEESWATCYFVCGGQENCQDAFKWGCWCQHDGWSFKCICSYIIICHDLTSYNWECGDWDWYCGWPYI